MTAALIASLRAHAPALILLVLLLGAGLAALSSGRRFAGYATAVAGLIAAAFAIDLGLRAAEAPLVYTLGDGARPFGRDLRIDGLAAAALLQIGIVCGLLAAVSQGLSRGAFEAAKEPLASALLLLGLAGLFAAAMAGHLTTLALGLHVFGLAASGLTALGAAQDRRALTAAVHQVTAVGVGGALSLLGAALALRGAGADDFAALAISLEGAEPGSTRLIVAGLALAGVGMALQAGVAPLHGWAVLAVSRGPHVGALALGCAGLAMALYAMLRIAALASQAPGLAVAVDALLGLLGFAALLFGAAHAAAAADLRRLALHAAFAQCGAGLLAVSLHSGASGVAGFLHVQAAALGALAALSGAAIVSRAGRAAAPRAALDGLSRRAPIAATAISVGLLSLAGAPLTIGFTANWLSFGAFLEAGWWAAAVALALASLALALSVARALERVWLRDPTAGAPITAPRLAAWAPLAAGAFGALAFGIDASWPLDIAQAAADALARTPAP